MTLRRIIEFIKKKYIFKIYFYKIIQLLTMDTSAPKTMKNTANCDISCESQNSVNH